MIKSKRILIMIIGIILGLILFLLYRQDILINSRNEVFSMSDGANNVIYLGDGDTIYQKLYTNYSFDEIEIDTEINKQLGQLGQLGVVIRDLKSNREIESQYVVDTESNRLKIIFSGKRKHTYLLEIMGIDIQKDSEYCFYTNPNYSQYGNLSVNDIKIENNLCIHFIKNMFLEKTVFFCLLWFVLVALLVIQYICLFERRLKIEDNFLIGAVCLGVVYLILFSPFSVADEKTHFYTSYFYSDILLGEINQLDGSVLLRETDKECLEHFKGSNSLLSKLQNWSENEIYVGHPPMVSSDFNKSRIAANGNIFIYLPCVLGICFAKLFGLGIMPLFVLAKSCNLIVYITMAYWGVKRIPFGKCTMAIIASLPIVLTEAGSLSYDSFTNGISFAFIGYVLSIAFREDKVKMKEMVFIIILCIMLGFSKGGLYLILTGLLMIVGKNFWDLFKKNNIWIWISWVLGLLGYCSSRILNRFFLSLGSETEKVVTTEMSQEAAIIEKMSELKTFMTLSQCIERPFEVLRIMIYTILNEIDTWILSVTGDEMFWYDLGVPKIIPIIILILLVTSFFYDIQEKKQVFNKWKNFFPLCLVCAIVFFTIFVMILCEGMLDGVVLGVQGRYFVPVIPLVLIPFADRMIINDNKARKVFWRIELVYLVYIAFVALWIIM